VRRGDAAVDVVEERKHLGSPRGQRAQVSACAGISVRARAIARTSCAINLGSSKSD
jgi:hypothetical protein